MSILIGAIRNIFAFLIEHIRALVSLYILFQIITLIAFPISYTSDSLNYYRLAQQCIAAHSIYPAPAHIYEDYIIAPLFVNILILVLSIYNSVNSIGILNIIASLFQLLFVYKIAEKIFGINAAKTAIILYALYLNSLGFILMNMTELVFNCFALGSIYFFLKGNKKSYFLAGLFAGAAIGVRPIGWVLLIIYLVIVLKEVLSTKRNKNPLLLLIGMAFFIFVYGGVSYFSFGEFIFSSNNGPINILIGASDNASGGYNASVFDRGNNGYIKDPQQKTYYEKENYWKEQAQNWILKHPLKWVSLFPLKLVHIFAWDDITLSHLFDNGKWNLYRVIKEISISSNPKNILVGFPIYKKILFMTVQIVHHLYYYLLIWVFIIFIKKNMKKIFLNKGIFIMIAFIVLGVFMNLATFGDARFKYPYVIMGLVLISKSVYGYLAQQKILNNILVKT